MNLVIGSIKENSVSKPKPFPVVKCTPVPVPISIKKTSLHRLDDEKLEKSVGMHDVDDLSGSTIENMSSEEIQAALEEISSLLSAKNIKFLQQNKSNGVSIDSQSPNKVFEISHSSTQVQYVNTEADNLNDESASARFDLQGRRVISSDSLKLEVASYLKTQYRENSYLCDKISSALVDCVIACDVCFNFVGKSEYPSDLFNHEFNPDSPGYDLREILELFRSNYPQQRTIAGKMILGILQWRDCFVSLPSYLTASVNASFSGMGSKFSTFCSSLLPIKQGLSELGVADTVLVDTLLKFCGVEKLPSTLPSLLLWSVHFKNSPSMKFNAFLTLLHYLRGNVEKEFQSLLWQGLWGSYGVPPVLTPHSKRPTVSYEQHFVDCLAKANSKPNPNDPEDNVTEDHNIEFILKCRWNRVDAIVDRNLIKNLAVQVGEVTSQLIQAMSHWNKVEISSYQTELSIGIVCLDILNLVPSAGNRNSIDDLFALLLVPYLSVFLELDCAVSQLFESGTINNVICDFVASWWSLVSEMSRWNDKASYWLFEQQDLLYKCVKDKFSILYKHDCSYLVSSVVWCLRACRVALTHKVNADIFLSLLLTSETININNLLLCQSQSEKMSEELKVEIFCLFEQSAIYLAHKLMDNTDEGDNSWVFKCCESLIAVSRKVAAAIVHINEEPLLLSAVLGFLVSVVGCSWHSNIKEVGVVESSSRFRNAVLQLSVRGIGLIHAVEQFIAGKDITITVLAHPFLSSEFVDDAMRSIQSKCTCTLEGWKYCELFVSWQRIRLSCLCNQSIGDVSIVPVLQLNGVNCVLAGALAWQISRLHQVSVLLRLQQLSCCTTNNVIHEFECTICEFSDSLSGILVPLLNAYMDCMLTCDDKDNDTINTSDVKNSILTSLLGITMAKPDLETNRRRQRLGPFGVLLGDQVPFSSYVCCWLHNAFTGQFPLDYDWQFSVLLQIDPNALEQWLSVLERKELTETASISISSEVERLSMKVFCLLKLVTVENSLKWTEVTDQSAAKFVSLLMHLTIRASQVTGFSESLLSYAKSKFFSAQSLMSRKTKSVGVSNLALLDLADKILDSALGLYIHPAVHSAALSSLLLPSLPVVVRSKVWNHLADLQLLHLLENDDVWVTYMNVFARYSAVNRSEISLLRAMLASISLLRGGERDLKWHIVSVVLFQISLAVFSLDIVEAGENLLVDILKNSVTGNNGRPVDIPDMLVKDLLMWSADLTVSEYHSRRTYDESLINLDLLKRDVTCDNCFQSLFDILCIYRPHVK